MKHIKIKANLIVGELFQFSLVTYIILLIAETLQEGFVSYFFNINILLGIVLLTGIIMLITRYDRLEPQTSHQRFTLKNLLYALMVSLGGALLVYYKTALLGDTAIIIAILTGGIIILLSLLFFSDNTK